MVYEMHVRGFTQNSNSGVQAPGTYLGVIEVRKGGGGGAGEREGGMGWGRGFTENSNSGVQAPGTYLGVIEVRKGGGREGQERGRGG